MSKEVSFEPSFKSFSAGNLSPIPTTETVVLDIPPTSGDSHYIRKHTQFSVSGTCVYGSLTDVVLRIYWYREKGFFPMSVVSIAGDTINLMAPAKLRLPNGDFSFTNGIEPALGIRITIQGTGTNTGSSLSNFEFSIRTN